MVASRAEHPEQYIAELPLDLVADEVASMTVDDYIDAFEASRN